MPQIFISYRRADTSPFAGRLYDRLELRFGDRTVFKDVDNLVAGSEFWDTIEYWVSQTDVMLVLIGPDWRLDRLHHEHDFVRREIELGLAHSPHCRVIPVLVNGAEMPEITDLPEDVRALADRHALPLRDDPDFNTDVNRLIRHIERDSIRITTPRLMPVDGPKKGLFRGTSLVIALIAVAAVIAGLIGIFSGAFGSGGEDEPTPRPTTQAAVSKTDMPSPTLTETPQPTDTATAARPIQPISDADQNATIEAEMAAILTTEAAQWTPTPTKDFRATAKVGYRKYLENVSR